MSSRRPGSTHFIQFLIYLLPQNNVKNFSSKRNQFHQNCCLNKPHFSVKNAPNTQQCSYVLYIFGNHTKGREKLCHNALSYQQTIRLLRQCVQQPTLCEASYWRAGLAWLQQPARMTVNISLEWSAELRLSICSNLIDPPGNHKVVCFQPFPSEVSRHFDEVTVHIGKRDRWPQLHIIDQIILRNFV